MTLREGAATTLGASCHVTRSHRWTGWDDPLRSIAVWNGALLPRYPRWRSAEPLTGVWHVKKELRYVGELFCSREQARSAPGICTHITAHARKKRSFFFVFFLANPKRVFCFKKPAPTSWRNVKKVGRFLSELAPSICRSAPEFSREENGGRLPWKLISNAVRKN